jgi:hypothetical protein
MHTILCLMLRYVSTQDDTVQWNPSRHQKAPLLPVLPLLYNMAVHILRSEDNYYTYNFLRSRWSSIWPAYVIGLSLS